MPLQIHTKSFEPNVIIMIVMCEQIDTEKASSLIRVNLVCEQESLFLQNGMEFQACSPSQCQVLLHSHSSPHKQSLSKLIRQHFSVLSFLCRFFHCLLVGGLLSFVFGVIDLEALRRRERRLTGVSISRFIALNRSQMSPKLRYLFSQFRFVDSSSESTS